MEAFFNAVQNGNIDHVKEYIEINGTDIISQHDHAGFTALGYAASNHDFKMVKYLVNKGANVNSINGGYTPILLAVSNVGRPEEMFPVVLYLADHGANINSNLNGFTVIETINDMLETEFEGEYDFILPINSIDDIRRIYRTKLFKPWKRAVRKVKVNNRIVSRNRKFLENLTLPQSVSKSNLPPNVIDQISRMTLFGKRRTGNGIRTVNSEIKYLKSI